MCVSAHVRAKRHQNLHVQKHEGRLFFTHWKGAIFRGGLKHRFSCMMVKPRSLAKILPSCFRHCVSCECGLSLTSADDCQTSGQGLNKMSDCLTSCQIKFWLVSVRLFVSCVMCPRDEPVHKHCYLIWWCYLCSRRAGRDIKDFEDLPTGQVAWNLYLSGWLIDLPTTSKCVYYTQ